MNLPALLRHFAERVPACWEGNDADKVVEVLSGAADVLDMVAGDFDEERNPLADWQYEVARGDTRLGYVEWALDREAWADR